MASRLEALPGIRQCFTPARIEAIMADLGVEASEAQKRLEGLLRSSDGKMVGLVALLSEQGLKSRSATVAAVESELNYCQLRGGDICMTGAPVIVTELDRLGSSRSGQRYFLLTLLLSLVLLHYSLKHWGLSLSILGISLWGIQLTVATIGICGGEMNFILGALPVMVLIFTLCISIHFISYYNSALAEGDADALGTAMRESWNPCFLSTLTTLLGLLSLNVSTILPVCQFGYGAALGSVVALLVGLGITPALLCVWPEGGLRPQQAQLDFKRWGLFVAQYRRPLLGSMAVLLGVTFFGLARLKSHIEPVEFLPRDSKVLTDLRRVEQGLTNVDSIEAVIDFQNRRMPFVEKLAEVREIEARIRQVDAVRHTLSLASFFPSELPESPLAVMRLLSQAQAHGSQGDYLAKGDRLWRISIRINLGKTTTPEKVIADLAQATTGSAVQFTGITPLLESAQREIFTGFWQSFTGAFVCITLVMVICLRSLRIGMVAMVPNVVPIWLVFGAIGFCNMPVDIGMMMTGSIALGISVDCTFHFLVKFRELRAAGHSAEEAVSLTLAHTGSPLLDSTIVSSLGMMALSLSEFTPTARFGYLMAAQMVASLLGELVILPALLCVGCKTPAAAETVKLAAETARQPHYKTGKRRERVRH